MQTTAVFVPRIASSTARRLALGAVAGPLLFTAGWLILGAVSPGYRAWGRWVGPYSPVSQPISGLGLGSTGPWMNAAFIACGVLVILGVAGSFGALPLQRGALRSASTVLLALSGAGAVLCGVFTLESFLPHFAGFLLAVCAPIVGFATTGSLLRRTPGFRRFGTALLLASPLTLALLVVFFATFDPTVAGATHGVAGLTQRALIVELHAAYVALGWVAFRGVWGLPRTFGPDPGAATADQPGSGPRWPDDRPR